MVGCAGRLITLRAGLTPEQELPILVHELAHWLAHRDARPGAHCTVFEYEADAVEALVMARLGLIQPGSRYSERPRCLFRIRGTRALCERSHLRRAGARDLSGESQSLKPPSTSMQRPVKKSFSNMNITAWAISSG